MDYNTFINTDINYPGDIADAILDKIATLCSDGTIDADFDDDTRQALKNDIVHALYDLKCYAENEHNADFWRTFYKVLSDAFIY